MKDRSERATVELLCVMYLMEILVKMEGGVW